jgi:subtilisin family serine protease
MLKYLSVFWGFVAFSNITSARAESFANTATNPSSQKLAAFQRAHVPSELILKFRQGLLPSSEKNTLERIGAKVKWRFRASNAILVRVPSYVGVSSLERLASWLGKLPQIEYVEPNHIVHAFDKTPNDPMFEMLYALENAGTNNALLDADIDAATAWERSTGSRRIVVGVIDTGIDYNHPDLAANTWTNPGESGLDLSGNDKRTNGKDDDNNGYVDDWRGWDFANNDNDPFDDNKHGTHCAGIIGAVGNNGIGVTGVNWNVSLVGLKFLKKDGSGDTANAIKAVEYATELGIPILNASWGGGSPSEALLAAIKKADAKKILLVAAAGNNYSDSDISPQYPASYASENIISVAATSNRDTLASFSNYGKQSVHIAAPGVDIVSTIPNNAYESMSGTSMATPYVAGAAALIKSLYPNFGSFELKERLLLSAELIPALEKKTITGARLNLASAIEEDTVPPNAPGALRVDSTGGQSVTFSWLPSGDDNSEGSAVRYEVRTASTPILSNTDWQNAKPATIASITHLFDGRLQTRLDNLPLQTRAHLAMRAFDNVGLASPLSESLVFFTKKLTRTFVNTADSMDGLTATGDWGLDTEDELTVFSASPGERYRPNLKQTLQFAPFAFAESSFLEFKTKYDMERNFDFGLVEVSWDNGQNWTEVKRITGATYQWLTQRVDLMGIVPNNTNEILIRFKFISDHSVTGAGWFIDDVSLFRAE